MKWTWTHYEITEIGFRPCAWSFYYFIKKKFGNFVYKNGNEMKETDKEQTNLLKLINMKSVVQKKHWVRAI